MEGQEKVQVWIRLLKPEKENCLLWKRKYPRPNI